uniref:Ovule protein n=1 Tax=Steinernema glaseri TaxID=37863 RepID=A0A1I7ZDL0_9BILA
MNIGFLKRFFVHWEDNGNLNFTLACYHGVMDAENMESWQTLMNMGEATDLKYNRSGSVFRHDTAKSIALCYSDEYYYFLQFRTCECDVSEECYLKENYPQFHDF